MWIFELFVDYEISYAIFVYVYDSVYSSIKVLGHLS